MTTYGPRFITPPSDEQELYPYRPVWRSLIIETAISLSLVVIFYTLIDFLHISLPTQLQSYLAVGLTFSSILFWFVFSWWLERRTAQPRQNMITVIILTMLVANSIGVPLVNQFFQVDNWLPLAPAVNRILGYTLTTGITQGIIKYLVLRYTIWPQNLRVRLDGVAYGIASGIGYATILNIQFITFNSSTPADTLSFQIFANYALHVSTGIVIGYGVSEAFFSNPTPIFLTIVLLVGAVVTGITIPIHAGLVNSTLSITSLVSAPKPLLGLGFSASLLIGISIIIAGLIRNADRLERESRADSED
ncbi:MAG: PrsW family intramembrane metalloprotease [Anaerolineaceae bacterium]|nr:PrsW family intramembrane metalloprotease [Anaerolineaceae bacterium]